MKRAETVATETLRGVSKEADRQGLTTEELSKSIEGATQGVRSVVDKGLKAALGQQEASVSAATFPAHKS